MQNLPRGSAILPESDSKGGTVPDTNGQWRPGQSGNPAGRPRGSKNRRTQLAEELEEQGSAVATRVVQAALAGDMQAASIVMQRICPPLRAQTERVSFPLNVRAPLADQAQEILSAVAEGHIDPETGRNLINCLATVAGLLQTDELAKRLELLERGRGG